MSIVHFKVTLFATGSAVLVTLPKEASAKLPSRGMVVVEGAITGLHFRAVLQPDGEGSHWFTIDKTMQKAAKATAGDDVSVEIEPTKTWPEPAVPTDLKHALAVDKQAHGIWKDITPMARWEWINWLNVVKQYETRKVRPAKLCSMLRAGKRRPCCFNRALRMPPKNAELI